MRILIVPPPSRTLPCRGYGRTQRVCIWLTQGLEKIGQHVLIGAVKGSEPEDLPMVIAGKTKPSSNSPRVLRSYFRQLRDHIPYRLDVIHGQGYWIDTIREFFPDVPLIATIHGHGEELSKENLVFISESQKREYQRISPGVNGKVIHNPIKIDEFRYIEEKQDYLLFMARLDWDVKGIMEAIEVARRVGMPLKIAGPGFNGKVKEAMTPDMEYVGEVFGERKNQLLANARALLYPTKWPEPFGLAPAEANACGTPAVVLNNGAMPEVVKDGVSGFVCDSIDQMCHSVGKLNDIKPADCRDWVQQFDYRNVAGNYLKFYQQVRTST